MEFSPIIFSSFKNSFLKSVWAKKSYQEVVPCQCIKYTIPTVVWNLIFQYVCLDTNHRAEIFALSLKFPLPSTLTSTRSNIYGLLTIYLWCHLPLPGLHEPAEVLGRPLQAHHAVVDHPRLVVAQGSRGRRLGRPAANVSCLRTKNMFFWIVAQ